VSSADIGISSSGLRGFAQKLPPAQKLGRLPKNTASIPRRIGSPRGSRYLRGQTPECVTHREYDPLAIRRPEKAAIHPCEVNETLAKVLCHNLVVLIHEMYELGIEPHFS
jgi:hypothetical protein